MAKYWQTSVRKLGSIIGQAISIYEVGSGILAQLYTQQRYAVLNSMCSTWVTSTPEAKNESLFYWKGLDIISRVGITWPRQHVVAINLEIDASGIGWGGLIIKDLSDSHQFIAHQFFTLWERA